MILCEIAGILHLVPASAGVIPIKIADEHPMRTCPRIRGGDPSSGTVKELAEILSPHPRG